MRRAVRFRRKPSCSSGRKNERIMKLGDKKKENAIVFSHIDDYSFVRRLSSE